MKIKDFIAGISQRRSFSQHYENICKISDEEVRERYKHIQRLIKKQKRGS